MRWKGLWLFPGAAIVWLKVQGALNRYWKH